MTAPAIPAVPIDADALRPHAHLLKVWPEYFAALADGRKSFEIRKNDRDFKVGDRLTLAEWVPERSCYTGARLSATVTYATNFEQRPGYVVLGLDLSAYEAGRDACAEAERLRKENERLRSFVERVAAQKTWNEFDDEEEASDADWEGGFARLVDDARAALTPSKSEDQESMEKTDG